MSQQEPVIVVKDLYKTFKLPHEQHSGVKQILVNIFKKRSGYTTQKVLSDISFEVQNGEFFGIVGRNGSGKSTLLKLLAGIYTPDKGYVHVAGTLTPFIELGVGFNPELTGRENVFMNGALLGFDHNQVESMYKDIVSFAELEDFMDQKLKNYSSGMQVRLAFSIAIRAKSDVLLIDEVLAVGDSAFQQKCFEYFEQLKKEKRTIILITHDMGAVKRFCNRAMIIKQGSIAAIGDPTDVADIYTEENIENIETTKEAEKDSHNTDLKLTINKKRFRSDEELFAEVTYRSPENMECFANISVVRNGAIIADLNTRSLPARAREEGELVRLRFSQVLKNFNAGTYSLYISLHRRDDDRIIQHVPKAATFLISGYDKTRDGAMRLDGEWQYLDN